MFLKHILFHIVMLIAVSHRIAAYPAIQTHSSTLQSISATSQRTKTPDVASTIDQVHKILQEDPTLPRLTRGEIEELFEQVTKEEYQKSLQSGDENRADYMRALMLVLPYNTDNTTEENLQELYTRPPITKVIDSYSIPQPQKFQTPASVPSGKIEVVEVGNLAATTYKPSFRLKEKMNPNPTTYHPAQSPFKISQLTTAQLPVQEPVTNLPLLPNIEEDQNKGTRYSSSYSAKDNNWSLLEGEWNQNKPQQKFTPMPDLSGILHSMGMGIQTQSTKRFKLEDYYQSVKPAMISSIKQSDRYPGTIDIADFTRTLPPRPNTDAYLEFQPLNIGEEIRVQPEVEHYLNRFGIVNRKRKQIKPEDTSEPSNTPKPTEKEIDIDVKTELPIPNVSVSSKAKEQPIKRIDTNVNDSDTNNVQDQEQPIKRIDTNVNDSDTNNVQDQEDLAQLTKLLNNLRELERLNVSLTADMLKTVDLNNFNLSSSIRAQGPDPVTSVADSQKNDIKRQSASESTSEPTRFNLDLDLNSTESELTTISPITTTEDPSSTTEEEPRNGSLADLEDSFGGPDPITEDPSPPPKKNGFYFLADWNSFLEVGEAGNDQVVVRFDPKIGDPRRFLKVTVP